jgi:molecular chaperone DnaJ
VLGVNKSVSTRDVKAAYFARAKRFHPDSNPSEEARQMFQLLAEAYEVLADEKKRKNYDECGSAGFVFGGMAHGPQRPSEHSSYDAEELFEKIFGEASK